MKEHHGSSTDQKKIEFRPCEEIVKTYPSGIFYYYEPNQENYVDLKRKLQTDLPKHFVVLISQTKNLLGESVFPADCGTQLGNTFYSYTAMYTQGTANVPLQYGSGYVLTVEKVLASLDEHESKALFAEEKKILLDKIKDQAFLQENMGKYIAIKGKNNSLHPS